MLGVYVHVPFCAVRCGYCDFATWTDRGHLMGAYIDACVADVRTRVARGELAIAGSVFVGGGTPSLLPAAELVRLLAEIPRAAGCEVTVEANPDSIDREKLDAYLDAGVDRVSLGVQSMRPHVLAALGRTHDTANVLRAVALVRAAGFGRLNLDLIYGAAGESLDDWCGTVEEALDLEPDHVSAYALTVEPGTPLGARVATGEVALPDDDDQAGKYELADELLAAAGLHWYEISNWALPGQECRHNLLSWSQGEYLGIGCAAHGHTAGRRWWTVRTPEQYIDAIAAGASPEAGSEALDPAGRAEEAFALALRTRGGAPIAEPGRAVATDLAAAGLLELTAAGAVLTRAGRLLAGDVTSRLLVAGAADGAGAADRAATTAPGAGTR